MLCHAERSLSLPPTIFCINQVFYPDLETPGIKILSKMFGEQLLKIDLGSSQEETKISWKTKQQQESR